MIQYAQLRRFCVLCSFLFVLLWSAFPLQAQYNAVENKIWTFGSKAGLNFVPGGPLAFQSAIDALIPGGTLEASATVCNSSGMLQFYTDGSQVWNRLGLLMPNGVDLTGLGQGSTNSTSQGALIIPMPDSAHKYYVFSLTAVDQVPAVRGRLFYSVVNMNLNSGLGDVEPSAKGIVVDSGLTEKMIGIVGDRCNIWVLTCVRGQALYKAFEITASGLNTAPVVSPAATSKNLSFGYLAVSPDRKRIAASEQSLFGGNNGLEIARFNAATGLVYDPVQLEPQAGYYGIAFSPDNTKLYGSSFQQVYQFDLNAPVPANTKVAVTANGRNTGMQLGRDGKIYFQHNPAMGNSLSYIRYPNLSGTLCEPVTDAISLLPGTSVNFGLHNTVPVFSRDTQNTFTIEAAGCFAADYRLLASDTSGWGYEWNTGATGPSLIVTAPGQYLLRYHTAPCIYHTDTFLVTFPNGVLPQIGTGSSCKGTHNGMAWAHTFTGDTVSYQYTWCNAAGDTLSVADSMQHAAPGHYTLRVQTILCDTVLSFTIAEEEYHVGFVADTLICLGTSISFINNADNYFTSFIWDFGDNITSTQTSPQHLFAQPGSYTVMLAGAGAVCRDTVYRHILVDAPLAMEFTRDRSGICMGESILLTPQYDSSLQSLQTLHWQLGPDYQLITGAEAVQHAFDKAGRMPLQMTATFRVCPPVDYFDTVEVYALPHVDLGPDSVLCLQGTALPLANLAATSPGRSYVWSTGDTTANISARHPGIYSLRATDSNGCSNSVTIRISKSCFIDIPNAFTPNGDGHNDNFFPRQVLSGRLTGFQMQIWNRWGQLVFESERTDGRGWDGRFNGKEQPEGVYIYQITAIIDNRLAETYRGNVTLLR